MRIRAASHAVTFALLAAALASSTLAQEEPAHVVEAHQAPVPLVFQKVTITSFRARVANLSPEMRAKTALDRLVALRPPHVADEVRVEAMPDGRVLFVGDTLAFSVVTGDLDRRVAQTTDEAAETARQRLVQALRSRAEMWSPAYLARGAGLTILVTIVFVVSLRLLLRARRAVLARLAAETEWKRRYLTVGGFDLFARVAGPLRTLTKIVSVLVALSMAHTWLLLILNYFPWTEPVGRAGTSFLLETLRNLATAFLHALPGLITVVIVLALARFVTTILRDFFRGVEERAISLPGMHPDTAGATRRIVSALIWLFAVVVAYPYLPGAESVAFKGVSVFVGLLFTLGSAGVVGHTMAGLVLVYSRALGKGDYVKVGDVEGFVTEVGALSTKIANLKNEEFTIPNTVMVGSTIKNFSRLAKENGAPLTTSVSIGYDAPWRQVHAMLATAADRTDGIRKSPAPVVLQTALSDFYVEYQLVVRLEDADRRAFVLSRLHQNIQDAFNEHGVQIMSPHFEAQPEQPVVVPKSAWRREPAAPEGGTEA